MDLSAQHTVGAHSSFFLPSPGPGGQGEEKQSQYPSQLFIERQGVGAGRWKGAEWGGAVGPALWRRTEDPPRRAAPPTPPPTLRLKGEGRGMSLGHLSPAVLELPLVVENRDDASGWGA